MKEEEDMFETENVLVDADPDDFEGNDFEGETFHLTQAAVEIVERRDDDGGITTLREAREHYKAGDFVKADSLVLLVAMYGMTFGNHELIEAARKTKQFVASDR